MRIELDTPGGTAWAELDRPRGAKALLALTHGARAGVETADLLAIRDAAVEHRIAVALITQAYRAMSRRSIPMARPQDEAWRATIAGLCHRRGLSELPLIVGGRSNGARVACRTALDVGATAVVALAFPVHQTGHPEKMRLHELDATGVPTLVVQGERDPFGIPPEDERRELVIVPGTNHSLDRNLETTTAAVVDFVLRTVQ